MDSSLSPISSTSRSDDDYSHRMYSGSNSLIMTNHVSAYQDEMFRHQTNALPALPSHRFRFSVWHDLNDPAVSGSKLRAPRIRDGPPIKNELFYKLHDANGHHIHHSLHGKEWKDYRDKTEAWEALTQCNFSYQDLSHDYQRDNFLRVLKRLHQAEDINLMENNLTDLSSVTFPKCIVLNLRTNYLKSFKNLPRLPRVKHINLDDNNIEDLSGLDDLRKSPLISLSLKRNPIEYTLDYRQWIFHKLPSLKYLDGLPKQPEDNEFSEPHKSPCVLS